MEKILERETQGVKMADLWSRASPSQSSPSTHSLLDVDVDVDVDGDLLSAWEIIDPSDDEVYSFDDDDGFGFFSPDLSAKSLPDHLVSDHHDDDGVPDVVVKDEPIIEQYKVDVDVDVDVDDSDDDDDDDGYELDDELVPKCVSDRFGRQRLRKLGKRAYPKMNKSKRLPYYYNRPGCVHGKHGLGLKHSII
ncbi:uncharacterized protein LOC132300594 [Cornus florida]|uniref:uncharacterized protein LOC132300594 n=1 Tax=Cornus florida TaxID=4283 RepID=UPI00289C2304|nr:uncharacterized protein LOC132300594 [Cornus florida]